MKIEYFDLDHQHGSTTELLLPQTAVVMQPTKTLTGVPQLAVLVQKTETPMVMRSFLTLREWEGTDVPDANVKFVGRIKSKGYYIFEVTT